MSTQPKTLLTPSQYLARERAAAFKSEFYHGEMFSMAGASRRHNLIVGNLVRETGNALKDRLCEIYPSDMRVKVTATGLYTYPDATIVCGERQFEDAEVDTLLNPTILFEVLSKSTEAYDRGVKSAHYRKLASVRQYALIAQDRPSVECYLRQSTCEWLLRDTCSLTESVDFPSLGFAIPMTEFYRNVDFSEQETVA